MYFSTDLELWNLTPGVQVFAGAQKYFNVVGCLKYPSQVLAFSYVLNGLPERPIFFNSLRKASGRLQSYGDFSIDTILIDELRSTNQLVLYVSYLQAEKKEYYINFPCFFYAEKVPKFCLNMDGISDSQQIGQIVDGKWYISHDNEGIPCLEIKPEDSGYDRIILMGHRHWAHSYEINAQLCVTQWTKPVHNVGLLFKWNPHLIGNGVSLPSQWSTGLGYFYSQFPGLRIRFGVDVHLDAQNNKQGDYILGKGSLSSFRYFQKKVLRYFCKFFRRINPSFSQKNFFYSEMIPGIKYNFCLRIHPEQYSLTVWRQNKKKPAAQVIVHSPVDRLPCGSVGIIAYNAGVRVYDFQVSPIRDKN